MNLFIKLKLDDLNKVIKNLPFHKHQTKRNDMAQFCEHDGICIYFTNAGTTQKRTTWHALVPCALKPWWLFLKPSRINPLRRNKQSNKKNKITKNAAKQQK